MAGLDNYICQITICGNSVYVHIMSLVRSIALFYVLLLYSILV